LYWKGTQLRTMTSTLEAGGTVLLRQGALKGALVDGVYQFLNIPYAQPPIGDLRWRAPQKLDTSDEAGPLWDGVRENPRVLSKCPQPALPFDFEGPPIRGHAWQETEDCLILNVFARGPPLLPDDGSKAPVPVIFYIHGGAGKFGCSHTDGLSGHQLVKAQDVVYVSANYRLGIFGFLAHPELRAEEEEIAGQSCQLANGSYGVLDLVAALTWVQENIKEFGGDPTRVTIWGLSTGSQLVHCLLVCPQARGLFHSAMMQSCVDFGNVRKLTGAGADIWQGKSAEQWGELAGEEWGCPRGKGQLAKMREVSAQTLAGASFGTAANDAYLPATDRRPGSSRPYSTAEAFFF